MLEGKKRLLNKSFYNVSHEIEEPHFLIRFFFLVFPESQQN